MLSFLSNTGNQMLLRYDDTWNALIEHYEERECIVDDRYFQRLDRSL